MKSSNAPPTPRDKLFPVRLALRILAAVVFLAAVWYWAAHGSHRGWTASSIERYTHDPDTGMTGVTYEDGFIPGLDFLVFMAMISTALVSSSFIFVGKKSKSRRRSRSQPSSSQL